MPTSEKAPAEVRYPLAKDTIDREDIDQLIEWLKGAPRLSKDRLTVELEEKWSRWAGRAYSLFCNSGSSANLLMYYVLLVSGRLKNKKVIVPATGWVTTIAPAIQFGFEPLMCDVDPETFGLNLDHLESLLKKHKPSTVTMVQVLGVPHKMNEILRFKEKYGFFLLEDACAAVGSMTLAAKWERLAIWEASRFISATKFPRSKGAWFPPTTSSFTICCSCCAAMAGART